MGDLIIELSFLILFLVLVFIDAPIRLIVLVGVVYLGNAIRNTRNAERRTNARDPSDKHP